MTALLWLRRDLRRADHPALLAAHEAAGQGEVVPVFVLDPALIAGAGAARTAWLGRTLAALLDSYEGALHVVEGDPVQAIPELAAQVGAATVHISRETTPVGRRRDERVGAALAAAGRSLIPTGTPYAVGPGLVVKDDDTPYRVFTPFARAWREHGWPDPCTEPSGVRLRPPGSVAAAARDDLLARLLEAGGQDGAGLELPPAGEAAAMQRWREFRDGGELTAYDIDRDRPDLDATTRLSPYLKYGVVHPRTLLADLRGLGGDGPRRLVTELAWREFYADVLWHHPGSARRDLRPALQGLDYDDPGEGFDEWAAGRTGFPIVDAGMRQLLATGWMHNRVRMITASFLTKDLHVWWPHGARHFLRHLIDGDVASNSHGWQWVAGTGTDAAPYFRIFNPVSQGLKFDPHGDYVRRWVPELRHLIGKTAHEPWRQGDGYAHGYPARMLDHGEERREALRRYERARR